MVRNDNVVSEDLYENTVSVQRESNRSSSLKNKVPEIKLLSYIKFKSYIILKQK